MSYTHLAGQGPWFELRDGARKQAAVIMAIIFKDFRVQLGKSRIGMLWVLLQPLTQMFVLSALWYLAGRTEIDGVHVTLFISTGIIPYLIIRTSISKIHTSVKVNASLFDYQQVKPFDAIIASFILNMVLILVAAATLFFILGWFLGIEADFPKILELVGIFAMMLCMGFGISMILSVYGVFYEAIPRAAHVATKPLIFISAVMYSVNDLPNAAREILAWNPLLQFIAYVRHYALGLRLIPEVSFAYIGLLSAVSLGVGFLVYYVNRFKLIQR